ncbi:MAG TPA: aspartate/glutamate racemase family protein [Dongiaceae bacterium]
MAPIEKSFRTAWPEARTFNILDESLYADVGEDGDIPPSIMPRLTSLLRHCELSEADGVLFTGSTFGPAVEEARRQATIPVLKSDEAVAERAVGMGEKILLMCTAQRSAPVVLANIKAAAKAASVQRQIDWMVVPGAKEAISRGDISEHDRLIAEAAAGAKEFDVIVFGQFSMAAARDNLPAALAKRVLTSAESAALKMRSMVER